MKATLKRLIDQMRYQLSFSRAKRILATSDLGGTTQDASATNDWTHLLASWAQRQLDAGSRRLLDAALPEFERVLIRTALARSGGRRQDAAKLLGWGRNTLTRKMRELSMDD